MKKRIALIPGSFDPFTRGHRALVEKAAESYSEVVVAVMNNADKSYLFSASERLIIAQASLEGLSGVEVIYDDGMLYKLFDRVGADTIVKGVRNESDRIYEENMARYNIEHNPRAKTELLVFEGEIREISSSAFREALRSGADFLRFITPSAVSTVFEILKAKGE